MTTISLPAGFDPTAPFTDIVDALMDAWLDQHPAAEAYRAGTASLDEIDALYDRASAYASRTAPEVAG